MKGYIVAFIRIHFLILSILLWGLVSAAETVQDVNEIASFHAAVESGDYEKVQSLSENMDNLDDRGKGATTPLMKASMNGYLNIVQFLVEKGADVNAKDSINEYTPLHFAATHGHLSVVNYLLEKGANPLSSNKSGELVIDVARNNGHNEVADAITNFINQLSSGDSEQDSYLGEVSKIVSEQDEVLEQLKRYDDLVVAFNKIKKTGQSEGSAWISRRAQNSSRVVSAVKRQLGSEFEIIETTALSEDANSTASLCKDFQDKWTETLNIAFKELRLQMRQERMGMDNSANETGRSSRRRRPPANERSDSSESEEENEVSEREQEIQENAEEWIGLRPDGFRDFSETIHNRLLNQYILLRHSAEEERAPKTLTVIDNIILARHLRQKQMMEKFDSRSDNQDIGDMPVRPRRGRGRSQNEQDSTSRSRRR